MVLSSNRRYLYRESVASDGCHSIDHAKMVTGESSHELGCIFAWFLFRYPIEHIKNKLESEFSKVVNGILTPPRAHQKYMGESELDEMLRIVIGDFNGFSYRPRILRDTSIFMTNLGAYSKICSRAICVFRSGSYNLSHRIGSNFSFALKRNH